MPHNEESTLKAIAQVLKTVQKLRAPDGCPWDREQTHQSLRPYLIEETYETLDVLDQIHSKDDLKNTELKEHFIEEWGDVLLQILLHLEIASEGDPSLTFENVAKKLNEKLIRRHPHVFGETTVKDANEVVQNWAEIKKAEKQNASKNSPREPSTDSPQKHLLDTIPQGFPSLLKTMKFIKAVTKVGFQWPDVSGPQEKLKEEVNELNEAIKNQSDLKAIEHELGDVLFSVCNIAHFFKIDPELALRKNLDRFKSRFNFVEDKIKSLGKSLENSTLEEMDHYWNQAKKEQL